MKSAKSLVSEHKLNSGSYLYSSSLGNILIGCPPEILKVMMVKHVPMPDTIVIPGTLYNKNSSQACLEFPFYHFLFIQQGLARGKKFRVMAKKAVCKKLADLLRVTLIGPTLDEVMGAEKKLNLPDKLIKSKMAQIVKEADFLAPKNASGKNYRMNEMIQFIPLEVGDQSTIYDAYQEHPQVSIKRTGEDEFVINCNKKFKCKLKAQNNPSPVYEIKGTQIGKKERSSKSMFTVRCLGSSEGFDPTRPANGYLLRINSKWVLWDSPAFLRNHLDTIGLSFEDLDAIFISHVHEDHLDVMETIHEGHKTDIYTSPEIFHCMLLKLQAIFNCGYQQARKYFNFHPIYVNKPFELFGAKFEMFYSSHVIPALGLRLSVPKGKKDSRLFISGDTLSKRMVQNLANAKIYSAKRKKEVENFAPDDDPYDIMFVDTGNGVIHGDYADYANNPNKVVYMHTGKIAKDIPKHHLFLKSGQRFIIHR